MLRFIALVHNDEGSDYGVSFPDLPGCVTAGATLAEARIFAEEALALHLAGLIEDAEVVPVPSSWDEVMGDAGDALAMAVPLREVAGTLVKVSVDMPKNVLDRVDARAARRGLDRSGCLVEAAQHELERDPETA